MSLDTRIKTMCPDQADADAELSKLPPRLNNEVSVIPTRDGYLCSINDAPNVGRTVTATAATKLQAVKAAIADWKRESARVELLEPAATCSAG